MPDMPKICPKGAQTLKTPWTLFVGFFRKAEVSKALVIFWTPFEWLQIDVLSPNTMSKICP